MFKWSKISNYEDRHKIWARVPPHIHRRNTSERAICTFKNHIISGLAACDPDFPIDEWNRLIEQYEFLLNLLQNSRINPKVSSWTYINSIFDFNKTPLTPQEQKYCFIPFHTEPAYQLGLSWYLRIVYSPSTRLLPLSHNSYPHYKESNIKVIVS